MAWVRSTTAGAPAAGTFNPGTGTVQCSMTGDTLEIYLGYQNVRFCGSPSCAPRRNLARLRENQLECDFG